MILITSESDFKKVLKSELAVVMFTAKWCKPCKKIYPDYEDFEEKYGEFIDFYKLDIDKCSEIADDYKIKSIPVFLFFSDGNVIGRVEGADVDELKAKIKKFIQ